MMRVPIRKRKPKHDVGRAFVHGEVVGILMRRVDPRIGRLRSRESNKKQPQMECSFMGMSQVADNPFDMSVPIR